MSRAREHIPRETLVGLMSDIRERMKNHPTQGAPTKAVYFEVVWDCTEQKLVYTRAFYNHVPETLHFLGAKDQLLDCEYEENFSPDDKPPRYMQASATGHGETASTISYNPYIKDIDINDSRYIKFGIVNQLPCPRCTQNLGLNDLDTLFIDIHSIENEWASRRSDHYMMSQYLARRAGIHIQTIDPDARLDIPNDLWIQGADNNDFHLETASSCLILPDYDANQIPFHLQEFLKYKPIIKPHMHYAAALQIKETGTLYLQSPVLSKGIGSLMYPEFMQIHETKYSYVVSPITAALIRAQKQGWNPQDMVITTSDIPLMRDIVNAFAANVKTINILTDAQKTSIVMDTPLSPKRVEHRSTHQEAGDDKIYYVYDQDSALRLLSEKLGPRFTMSEPVNDYSHAPSSLQRSAMDGMNFTPP